MSLSARVGQVVLVLLGLLSTVIAGSVYGPRDEPLEPDAQARSATSKRRRGVAHIGDQAGLSARNYRKARR